MDANERDAIARRRPWYKAHLQRELAAISSGATNAELGRYYRARVVAEAAGYVTPEAERIAGKGKALELLRACAADVEAGLEDYAATVASKRKAAAKRWSRDA